MSEARGAGDSHITLRISKPQAIARFAGSIKLSFLILGLTPQALCWHPLRGFSEALRSLLNCAVGVFLEDALIHHLFDGDVGILRPRLARVVAIDFENAQVD